MSRPDESETDAQLWRRVNDNDAEAFSVVFRRHVSPVFRSLCKQLGSRADAEDLTGAVFLTAWQKRQHIISTDAELLRWLLGIAGNTGRNAKRSHRRYKLALARLGDNLSLHEPSAPPERRWDEDDVHEAIRALPEQERRAVELCVTEGHSMNSAADLMGVPVGTAKSRLSRGRARARKHLLSMEATRRALP